MSRTRLLSSLLLTSLCAAPLCGAANAGGGYVPSAPAPVTTPAAPSGAATGTPAPAAPAPLIVTPRVPALPTGGQVAPAQVVPAQVTPAAPMTAPTTVPMLTTTVPAPVIGADETAPEARATLRSADGMDKGEVLLATLPSGELSVRVKAEGLAPGPHGMHVHTVGQCSNKVVDGKPTVFGAAEGHFDPAATMNHAAPNVPADTAHAGDLPMLTAGADGSGSAEFTTRKFSLSGAGSVVGRSLIIHADADDYQTDPSGNSGARVLCGVIEPVPGN